VAAFAKHFGNSPDKLCPKKLRAYQAYLAARPPAGTVVNRVAAVRTRKHHQFRDSSAPAADGVLSREEVSHLINAAANLFRRALLRTLYGPGMPPSELTRRLSSG
jgi:integrase